MINQVVRGVSDSTYLAQVVILVVDQQQRPDIPQDLASLPGSSLRCPDAYVELMQQCWATDPAERPSFERVISHLRCEAALLFVSWAIPMSRYLHDHGCIESAHLQAMRWCRVSRCARTMLHARSEVLSSPALSFLCSPDQHMCCAVQEYH